MADRFYCPRPPIAGRLVLEGDEAYHAIRVRRVKQGDLASLFDGQGRGYQAEVRAIGKGRVEFAVREETADRAGPIGLTVVSAVPKGERFDWLVEKATEIGVGRLVPLVAERSTVDPRASKLDRLRRLIIEASKQCGRNRLMELADPRPLADVLTTEPAAVRLLAHPGGLAPGAWPRVPWGSHATLAIGPEGGFTDAEVEAARAAGWTAVALGPTLLRIETAALVGAAMLLAQVRDRTG